MKEVEGKHQHHRLDTHQPDPAVMSSVTCVLCLFAKKSQNLYGQNAHRKIQNTSPLDIQGINRTRDYYDSMAGLWGQYEAWAQVWPAKLIILLRHAQILLRNATLKSSFATPSPSTPLSSAAHSPVLHPFFGALREECTPFWKRSDTCLRLSLAGKLIYPVCSR
jgi:hypothetical protein